uniref:hypothetical protein n=1 Tax=Thaumasiovibrio occultus TaxID=1891184 RepID=UPI000B361CD9|nr:hypothetical protein [Thaumasiovibrio occultus]
MNNLYIKKGSRVNSVHGIVDVLDVDPDHNTALVESCKDQRKFIVASEEIFDEPQLHIDCDKYY